MPEPVAGSAEGVLALGVVASALALCFVAALIANHRFVRAERAAMRARSEFLQSVTHELKTPLASIRLLAERLEHGRVGPDRQLEYFGLLADEATRLSVLIENVLDLGRIERGERAYDRRTCGVAEVVHEAIDVFRPLAQRDGMRVRAEVELDGIEAKIDRGAIVQALLNVLENARKYAAGSEGVVVRATRSGDDVVIDVRDFGPGVPADEREAIFERFRRGARQQHGNVAGVGLGLHLARSIVRAHGGDVVCVEPEGEGAEFRIRLPQREAS
ncbi:MAG: HAMP domain-containing histidine kinase [Planctomycetes bacterium]|nr:HAMP domain-containing histidine kinase [Planctomycetota bacterium]